MRFCGQRKHSSGRGLAHALDGLVYRGERRLQILSVAQVTAYGEGNVTRDAEAGLHRYLHRSYGGRIVVAKKRRRADASAPPAPASRGSRRGPLSRKTFAGYEVALRQLHSGNTESIAKTLEPIGRATRSVAANVGDPPAPQSDEVARRLFTTETSIDPTKPVFSLANVLFDFDGV